jgi:fructosamine-3-kinase
VTLDDGREIFVKTNADADQRMFPVEARGLTWLAEAEAVRVPRVLAVSDGSSSAPPFLALEFIGSAAPAPEFDERLGRELAALHASGADGFGLDHDNFIGSLPQANGACATWAEFYATRRIEPQLRRAVDLHAAPAGWIRTGTALLKRLPELVGPPEPPARLHGDLWSGNLHVDDAGGPCLLDPAVYGGHREMDLAMLMLFGNPSDRFARAYDEAFPLADGAADRVALYQLYPLLVHVNLFGGHYVGSAEQAMARYV